MSNYVYSTATCSTEYVLYEENNSKDISRKKHSVTIKGGANVANKNIITPKGVVTEVNDADLELLEKHPCFIQAAKAGFLKVERRKENANKVANNMTPKDSSAPKTPDDPEFQGTTKVLDSATPKKRR